MIWIIAGPRITTNIAGKMQNTSGKMSLMVVLAAASSARCRRLVRMAAKKSVAKTKAAKKTTAKAAKKGGAKPARKPAPKKKGSK